MNMISPARIMGRLDYAAVYLLRRNGLNTTEANLDTPTILYALYASGHLPEPQRDACMRMSEAYLEARNRLQTMNMPVSEVDMEMARGRQEAGYLFSKYGVRAVDSLLADYDFQVDIAADARRRKKENLRNVILGLSIVALIAIIIVVYNLPYFAEGRLYDKYQEACADSPYLADAVYNEYMEKYPDGRHAQEVVYGYIVMKAKDPMGLGDALNATSDYLKLFPQGEYAGKVKVMYDSIWNAEIAKYETTVASGADPAAAAYVREMLSYMKAHNQYVIAVKSNAKLNLKEYSEYPADVRKFMEAVSNQSADLFDPKLPGDLVTIKDKVTQESASGWTSQVIQGLQDGFNSVFSPGFFRFVSVDELTGENLAEMPMVTVDYVVSTQETRLGGYAVPDIWSSKGTVSGGGMMVLGIAMDFKAVFTLPGAQPYEVTAKGDAGDEMIQADSDNCYNIMCRRCVDAFSTKIENSFGIERSKSEDDAPVIEEIDM